MPPTIFLPQALSQLQLFYQPQYHLKTHSIVGVEALLRWQHPEQGLLLPDAFIREAEASDKIDEIGLWVIQKACEQYKKWQDDYNLQIPITMNVSPKQLQSEKHLNHIKAAILDAGVALSNIELELTESNLMPEVEAVVAQLEQLRAQGVRIAIDDFGIGYSSLSRLKNLPVSKLKLDASFVRDAVNDAKGAIIAQAVIDLAKNLSLELIAEGIETKAQQVFLLENGCDVGQGFLLSEPLTARQFSELIRSS